MTTHNEKFEAVLSLVKEGRTSEQAYEITGVSKSTLFRHMTKEQKVQLKVAKALNSKTSRGHRIEKDLMKGFEDDED